MSRKRLTVVALVAAPLLVLVIAQVGPVREQPGAIVDRVVDSSAPTVDPSRALLEAPRTREALAPRAAEVLFRAKQIVAQVRYLKVSRQQRGTYYLPPDFRSGQSCPPVCYDPPGFRDEEWSRTWEYDFSTQRARVRIDRPKAQRHLEEVFVGTRSYTRVNGVGPWFIQEEYVEGVYGYVFGGVYQNYIHFDLGWDGPWPVAYYKWGFNTRDAFEENIDGARRVEFGQEVACGESRCWTLVSRYRPEAGGQRGAVTWTLVVEQRTGRAVEARYVVVWDDGRALDALTRLYDYDVTNLIEAPE